MLWPPVISFKDLRAELYYTPCQEISPYYVQPIILSWNLVLSFWNLVLSLLCILSPFQPSALCNEALYLSLQVPEDSSLDSSAPWGRGAYPPAA